MSFITLYDCGLSSFEAPPMGPAVFSFLFGPVLFVIRVPFKPFNSPFQTSIILCHKKGPVSFPHWYYVAQHNASSQSECCGTC